MDKQPFTIKASDLEQKASEFGDRIAKLLEDTKNDHLGLKLNKKTSGEDIPDPTPEQAKEVFQSAFCSRMASRYVIIPD